MNLGDTSLPALTDTFTLVESSERKAARMSFLSSFSFRLGFAFAVLILGATSMSLVLVYSKTRPLLLQQMGNRLADIGRTATFLFGDEELTAISAVRKEILDTQAKQGVIISPAMPGEYRSSLPKEAENKIIATPPYQALVALLRQIKGATRMENAPSRAGDTASEGDPTLAFASLLIEVPGHAPDKVVQFVADSDYDHPEVPAPPGTLLFNNSPPLAEAFKGVVAVDKEFGFEQGMDILTAGVPVYDDGGKVVAVLRLYYDARGEANNVRSLRAACAFIIVLALVAAVLLASFLAWALTRDVRKLQTGAARVRDRDFSVVIDVPRPDELGMLAATLNEMIRELKNYSEGLEATNSAYSKFVPRQILDFLGRASIIDIQLGDQTQRQMTILFADIRSFTTISESMSARDNFDFINEYLKVVGPIVRANNGFIDKYIGDAIMGLFPNRPEDAVNAAIGIQRAIDEFNIEGADKGRPHVRVGIGIHRGNLMLGTVGEAERMDGTVISDAVNAASRLEGLSKTFGATIIISGAVLDALQGTPEFNHRYLGESQVKGKKNSLLVYEVLEGDTEDGARRKIVTKNDFEKGVKAFERGDMSRARRYFVRVLKVYRNDLAARLYLERCAESPTTPAAAPAKSSPKAKLIPVDEERFKKKL